MNKNLYRRDFIKQSGLLLAATLLPVPMFTSAPKFKMGLQLYSIRDAMKKDALGTIKKAGLMGYQDFETYGYEPNKNEYYGFSASEFKIILDDLELSTSSGHYGFADYFNKPNDALLRYVDQSIIGAKALGQKYITWPWLDEQSRSIDSFKALSSKLNLIGERVNKAGLGFAYHNHDFEFIDHKGQNGYEIILKETDPDLVKLQLDLYWVMFAATISPAQLIKKQPGRFVMWHIKDMHKTSRDYTELGNGSIDFHKILPEAKNAGLEYYFLEQGGNYTQNSMQSVADSAAYFKKNLQGYL